MAKVKISNKEEKPKGRPGLSPEARESYMISLAMDLAEERLRNGTATSQEVTHFLKLGANKDKEKLAMEKMSEENKLLRAKTDSIKSQKRIEELYLNALGAMKGYSGKDEEETDDEDIDDENYD